MVEESPHAVCQSLKVCAWYGRLGTVVVAEVDVAAVVEAMVVVVVEAVVVAGGTTGVGAGAGTDCAAGWHDAACMATRVKGPTMPRAGNP